MAQARAVAGPRSLDRRLRWRRHLRAEAGPPAVSSRRGRRDHAAAAAARSRRSAGCSPVRGFGRRAGRTADGGPMLDATRLRRLADVPAAATPSSSRDVSASRHVLPRCSDAARARSTRLATAPPAAGSSSSRCRGRGARAQRQPARPLRQRPARRSRRAWPASGSCSSAARPARPAAGGHRSRPGRWWTRAPPAGQRSAGGRGGTSTSRSRSTWSPGPPPDARPARSGWRWSAPRAGTTSAAPCAAGRCAFALARRIAPGRLGVLARGRRPVRGERAAPAVRGAVRRAGPASAVEALSAYDEGRIVLPHHRGRMGRRRWRRPRCITRRWFSGRTGGRPAGAARRWRW